MDFYSRLKKYLFRQANTSINQANAIGEESEITDVDEYFFIELMKQERYSVMAYHEQVRASHMILKTVVDGVQ